MYKRFEYIMFDGFTDYEAYITPHEVANLLNEFHEKNKKLLRKNGAMEEEIECLSEENKQLKQQVKQLQHWNKCLAEKRHQELSYNCSDR